LALETDLSGAFYDPFHHRHAMLLAPCGGVEAGVQGFSDRVHELGVRVELRFESDRTEAVKQGPKADRFRFGKWESGPALPAHQRHRPTIGKEHH
jgi:hypothetical protein